MNCAWIWRNQTIKVGGAALPCMGAIFNSIRPNTAPQRASLSRQSATCSNCLECQGSCSRLVVDRRSQIETHQPHQGATRWVTLAVRPSTASINQSKENQQMAINSPKRQAPKPKRSVIRWLLDSDPSIHWHRATYYLPCSSAGNDCKYLHTAPHTSSVI